MKKSLFFMSIILASLLMIACSNDSDDGHSHHDKITDLAFLDIVDAESLYISTGSASNRSARAADNYPKIFKITENTAVEEVSYLGKKGNPLSFSQNAPQPIAIKKVNNDYIFVGFGFGNGINFAYLVRKSDGAVFDMKNAGIPGMPGTPFNGSQDINKVINIDGHNNLYFYTGTNENGIWRGLINKVDLNGINSLSSICMTPSTDNVSGYEVDVDGNIFYTGTLVSDYSQGVSRIRKTNGGLYNITIEGKVWINLDGKLSYLAQDTSYQYHVKNIIIDSSYNVTEETYGSFSSTSNPNIYLYDSYIIKLSNRLLMINGQTALTEETDRIYEVYNPTHTPRIVTLSNLSIKSVVSVTSTENYYYIAGKDFSNNTFLIKVNPLNDSFTNILNNNDYDILSFIASETDGITFNALRMNDGKKIIGKVGINGGTVQVLDEESDVQIKYLERIN